MKINKRDVAQRISLIRQNKGLSMEQFGKIFGASKGSVSVWETGDSLPNNERIKMIADFADLSVQNLLYGDPVSVDDELIQKFKKEVKEKKDYIRQEIKLLWPAAKSGITFGVGFKEEREQAVKDRVKHDKRIEELEKFGFKYIVKNFNNFTYDKYLEKYPNSNVQEFTAFKEKQWNILKEKLDKLWDSLINTIAYYDWINSRFTDQITEDLEQINKRATEEEREDYYVNEVVQPFLDQAAKDFKEYIKKNTDIE